MQIENISNVEIVKELFRESKLHSYHYFIKRMKEKGFKLKSKSINGLVVYNVMEK
jgi:hypothetical protein